MKSATRMAMMQMLAFGLISDFGRNGLNISDEEIEKSIIDVKVKYRELMLRKGVQEFEIEGITIFARNEKNAIRKLNNIKKQLSQ